MAQVTEFPSSHSFQFVASWVWDLTDRIGWGMPNGRADVQLMQYHLNDLIPKMDLRDYRKRTPSGFAKLGFLVVDGYWGKETANALDSYLTLGSSPKSPDRVLDPVYKAIHYLHGDPLSGGLHGRDLIRNRIMYCLNRDYKHHYAQLANEDDFPEPLKSEAPSRRFRG
jgi:hypothetical protein